MSGKVTPLKRPEPPNATLARPWVPGTTFSRDGVDYELVTAGEIQSVDSRRGKKGVERTARALFACGGESPDPALQECPPIHTLAASLLAHQLIAAASCGAGGFE